MVADRDWLAMFQVQQTIWRYFDCVNRADFDAMPALFATDAVWEEPFFGLRTESGEGFVNSLREMTAAAQLLVLTPHCPTITMTGADSAHATTTFHEVTKGVALDDGAFGDAGTEVNVQQYGIYYDDLARIDGSWKFTHRLAVVLYVEPGTLSGDVVADRASLLAPTTQPGR